MYDFGTGWVITIEDDVMTGPRMNIMSENHPMEAGWRKRLIPEAVVIKRKAWIAAVPSPYSKGEGWGKGR